jgi:hypothetical protein
MFTASVSLFRSLDLFSSLLSGTTETGTGQNVTWRITFYLTPSQPASQPRCWSICLIQSKNGHRDLQHCFLMSCLLPGFASASLIVANADPDPEPVQQESHLSNLTRQQNSITTQSSTFLFPYSISHSKHGPRYLISQQASIPPPGHPNRRRTATGSQATPQFRDPTSSCHVERLYEPSRSRSSPFSIAIQFLHSLVARGACSVRVSGKEVTRQEVSEKVDEYDESV